MNKDQIKVGVGSQNPVKIEATKLAFEAIWPDKKIKVVGTNTKSGVSNQPMSDMESITGARNRANGALEESKADFGVGLEGGLQEVNGQWFDCGWIVVVSKDKKEGIGSTIRIETPSKMVMMIREGMELGDVNDKIFNRQNSKQTEGHFGLMTNNTITRTQGYRDGVIAALSRFVQSQVFEMS